MKFRKGDLLKIIPQPNFIPRMYATAAPLDISPTHFLNNKDILLALEDHKEQISCVKVVFGEKIGYVPHHWFAKLTEEDIVGTE
jgi:hypothetical protein